MANIIVNEISQNYTYNIGNSAFATVALPITASWGPAYGKPGEAFSTTEVDQLESIRWEHFPSTQAGLRVLYLPIVDRLLSIELLRTILTRWQ